MTKSPGLHVVGGSLLYVPDPQRMPARPLLPDYLIIFVHGFMSYPSAWQEAPRRILDALGIECTVFQYKYPANVWQAADARDAAADLETFLITTLRHYAHIVFVTHSTGAIVVKELLRRNNSTSTQRSGAAKESGDKPLLERTRCIINLAGAHNGGRRFARPAMLFYRLTWGLIARLIAYVPVIGPKFGYFELGNQLQPIGNNPFLQKLAADYDEMLRAQQGADMPRPVRFDYEARNDGVVINEDEDHVLPASRFNVAYALHFLSSLLRVAGSTIPERVFPQLLPGTPPPVGPSFALKVDLAYASHLFVRNSDKESGIQNLLSDEIQSREVARTQKELFDEIIALIKRGGSNIIVVTGPGGTGKSVLMRRLAKSLAADWLSSRVADNTFLPLVVNMKRLGLSSDMIDEYIRSGDHSVLWRTIQDAWKPVAHDLRETLVAVGEASVVMNNPALRLSDKHRPVVTREWIDQCWRSGRTILFLDSVDEFLNSYRLLGGLDFIGLIKHLFGREFGDVPKQIVIAIREGEADTMRLLEPRWFKLDRLSGTGTLTFLNRRTEAAHPGESSSEIDSRRQRLQKVFDALPAVARQTIGTPLVLSKLPNLMTIADPASLKTASSVLELALLKTIESDPFDNPAPPSSREITWQNATGEQRLDMLSVLGWIFACDEEGPYRPRPLEWLKSKLADERKAWDGQHDLPDSEAIRRISQAFRCLAGEGELDACLRRSVFQSIGGFAFDHRQWADLCIARFLSICVLTGAFRPLTERTYHPSIFLRIADYLSVPPIPGYPASIRRTTIDKMLSWLERDPRDGQFVIGNFGAIISHGRFGIDGDALAAVMDSLPRIPPLARHVVLSGFAYRALAGHVQDPTMAILKATIIPAAAGHIGNVNPATASLIWCVTRALYGNERAGELGPWPRPGAGDAQAIFDMVCPGFRIGRDDLAQRISLQNGYVQTAMSMLQDKFRTIASMHYLLFAVTAFHGKAAVAETTAQLTEIFGNSRFEDLLGSYRECPEVAELFMLAKGIFQTGKWA